jgi:hypothetical protein
MTVELTGDSRLCPFGARLKTMTFDIEALADQVLIDPEGAEERLGDRWATQPQVILFLRHFG